MADAAAAPAPEEGEAAEPKKKKPILLIVAIVLGVLLLIVSTMLGTFYFSGFFDHKSEAAAHEKVDELEQEAAAAKETPSGPEKVTKDVEASRFENNYMEMDKEFMTNITGSKKVMVVKVAMMTHYDNRVFDNVKKHELAIRSAMLDVMRQSTEDEMKRSEFRTELAAKLKIVVNDMLVKYEEFGGIEDVFFTSFVTQ